MPRINGSTKVPHSRFAGRSPPSQQWLVWATFHHRLTSSPIMAPSLLEGASHSADLKGRARRTVSDGRTTPKRAACRLQPWVAGSSWALTPSVYHHQHHHHPLTRYFVTSSFMRTFAGWATRCAQPLPSNIRCDAFVTTECTFHQVTFIR